jgi:hypothetical protein
MFGLAKIGANHILRMTAIGAGLPTTHSPMEFTDIRVPEDAIQRERDAAFDYYV